MSDDFARLVSSANPAAARAYQQPSGVSRPPRASLDKNPFLIDDFDEDYDAPTPDSRFHGQAQHQASSSNTRYVNQRPNPGVNPLDDPIDPYGTPPTLARGPSNASNRSVHGSGQPEGWIFDADIPSNNASTLMVNGNTPAFDGSKLFSGTINESSEGLRVGGQQRKKGSSFKFRKTWKWPWEKEKVLMGERMIHLNDEGANAESGFVSNYVSTSKYNVVTFAPKFLYGTIVDYYGEQPLIMSQSNSQNMQTYSSSLPVWCLKSDRNPAHHLLACIQQIPNVSPTNKWTTIVPLGIVLAASAVKETQEDLVRLSFELEKGEELMT